MLKSRFAIVTSAVISLIGFWLYFEYRTPIGIEPKGDHADMIAWIALGVAVLTFLATVMGVVQNAKDRRILLAAISSPAMAAVGTETTLKIFLASSQELSADRDAFDLYFRQRNDSYRKEGLYLEIVRWENFIDAMSSTRLQDEYNQAIRECDLFVSLFSTKAGKYTDEEFDVAHKAYKKHRKPLVYTYFKDTSVSASRADQEALKSLWAFQEKLEALGHFWTAYKDIEHLKRQFSDQLQKLKEAR